MRMQEDAPRDADGVLLDSVPEHIKNPAGPLPAEPGEAAEGDVPENAGPGALGRARRRAAAGAARAGSTIRRTASRGVGALGRAGTRAGSAFPSGTRGRAILLGGTAVVVAGAVAGGLVLQAHLRDERLRSAPGGVLALTGAPGEAWHVDLGDAVQPRIVPVGDLAAVTADGRVLGIDPATGAERWAVEVLDAEAVADGARMRCGPSRRAVGSVAVRTAAPSDPLVCVTEGATPEAVVIDAEGGAERRALEAEGDGAGDAGTSPVYAPLPDGGLAVLARDETPVDLGDARVVEDDDGVAALKGGVESAPGLTVRVEDAATGEPRWGPRTVAFDPDLTGGACVVWSEDGPELDVLGDLTWSADERRITASACGISARLVTADGTPAPAEPQDGAHVPWATDDPELGPATLPEGEDIKDVLVRTAGTAVTLTLEGRVVAYDAGSGDRLWTAEPLGDEAAAVAGSAVFGAYTDGRSAMLVVDGPSTGGEGQLRLVGLDLATGEVTWDVAQEEPYAQIASVDGHLVQVTGTGIAGLATG
ncbi:PQQ-binding-like beta-propeller repeat protein [Myceligenerans xiligouense]|uniref:Putative pyrroloquinoline-quinone binding quinoprotein n=1 Tax=Myceligenerans xiligouense TaxID=253184 RepID=A0A3N4YRY3_9MICO|nr:PQQ-binding-like beta-propeller repeat protein [Myceligenerans xiligouense]RPF23313.1 putative pyrroloquinoline-quinone binding quinoprotein [Myceligenerans xiligouense]